MHVQFVHVCVKYTCYDFISTILGEGFLLMYIYYSVTSFTAYVIGKRKDKATANFTYKQERPSPP